MKDTLPVSGLAYVKIDSINITGSSTVTLADYLTYATLSYGSTSITDLSAPSFFPYVGIAAAANKSFDIKFNLFNKDSGLNLIKGTQTVITINYSAVITSDAAINTALPNQYTLTVDRDGTTSTFTTTVNVYTYGLQIVKQDSEDDSIKLEGAVFTLQDDEIGTTGATSGNYFYFTHVSGTNVYTVAGVTHFDTDSAPDPGTQPQYFLTSDAAGLINIEGLDAGDYALTEVKAPVGYNILQKPQTVNVSARTTGSDYSNATVLNSKAIKLPSTGGIGTTMFTIGGLAILFLAGAFLVVNRKKIFGK
jgi:LPXTG-motif cell wall-anchored protein